MFSRFSPALLLTLFVFFQTSLEAVISLTSPSSEWTPILYLDNSDPTGDQQTGSPTGGNEADIVGDANNAALFKRYDAASDQFAFRIRLGAEDNPSQGYSSAFVLAFDVGGDGILDGYIGVDIDAIGPGGTKDDIGIFLFDGVADTPGNTESALASPASPEYSYELDDDGLNEDDNYSWQTVTSIDGGPNDIDGQGNDDYFLSFSVSFTDLANALGINEGTILGFVAITSQNLQQINNDFNGIDNNDPNFDPNLPWNDPNQPIVSQPYTPESEAPVPEPAAFALLLGLAAGFFISRRRQR